MTLPHANDLARRCASIRDPEVRVAYVGHAIREAAAEELVELVQVVQTGGTHADLLLPLALALAEPELEPHRQRAARIAAERNLVGVAELLGGESGDELPDVGELRVPDFGFGRPLTLGERKTLARRRDRTLLARVLQDPSPAVIEILLRNPSLTELDVVRLAARRPIDPETLRVIFRSVRWAVRYPVRRALVQNPYCPLDLALRMALLLNASDARILAASPGLRPPLREACARMARNSLQ